MTAEPIFFATPADFRDWLDRHHETESELLVGFYRKDTGKPSITWPESVDEALCVGWIDGIRRSRDAESYTIRFTPRKPRSIWSAINIARVAELTREGRMKPAGLRAFEALSADRSKIYSYEQRQQADLPEEMLARFHSNAEAWAFFESQPPGYRRTAIWWVVSAKKEETRWKRLDTLIADSAAGERLAHLRPLPPRHR
jgi:uncharacterized protein YdeI (YjbR/CyaY-like superfamily)